MDILRNKWVILSFVLTVAVIIVFSDFLIRPAIWSDEGLVIQLGRNLAETGNYNIAVGPDIFSENRHYYASSAGWVMPVSLALMFKVFGASFLNARLAAAFYLFGFIIIVFLLAHRLWGLKMAALSSFLLVTFAPLYGNGKSVLSEMPALFWLALGFYFWEIFRQKPRRQAIFSGLGFGLFFAAKPAFLILGLPILAVIHSYEIGTRKILTSPDLVRFWFLVFLAVFPTIWLGMAHPLNLENIQKTLSHYSNNYASPCVSCDIKSNLLMFFSHKTLWHLVFLAAVVVIYLIRRKELLSAIGRSAFGGKDWRVQWLFFFGIFDILYFLKSPGVFRYFFPLQIILLIILPICFFGLTKKLRFLLLILIGVQFVHLAWFPTLYYSVGPPRLEKYIEREILTTEKTIGVINAPAAAAALPSDRYFQLVQFVTARSYGITDGINPLDLPADSFPDYLIYREPLFIFNADTKHYLEQIELSYKKAAVFRDYIVMKKI